MFCVYLQPLVDLYERVCHSRRPSVCSKIGHKSVKNRIQRTLWKCAELQCDRSLNLDHNSSLNVEFLKEPLNF